MTPDDERHLLETTNRVAMKMDYLVSDNLREGKVPEINKAVDDHTSQISYWKGAIAVIALLMLVFGGVLAAHIMGGK